MNNSASHHQGGLSKGRQGSARSATPDLHSAHGVTRVTSTVYEEAGRARRGMERALTLFSLEMDICRFVLQGVMIELIEGGWNFFFLILFIYLLFNYFCLNCPPFLSPSGAARPARHSGRSVKTGKQEIAGSKITASQCKHSGRSGQLVFCQLLTLLVFNSGRPPMHPLC